MTAAPSIYTMLSQIPSELHWWRAVCYLEDHDDIQACPVYSIVEEQLWTRYLVRTKVKGVYRQNTYYKDALTRSVPIETNTKGRDIFIKTHVIPEHCL